ncbi:hypothetical protein ACFL49_00875 [Candidatus Omnitrophota bacterium]
MSGRNSESQRNHDELVRVLAKHYSSLGYIGIRADIPDYSQTPVGIYWTDRPEKKYIPDIVCSKNDENNTIIVAEAETCETLMTEHTREQWKMFSAHAKSKGGEFHIITPKSCKEKAEVVATENNLIIHKFWWV